MKASSPKVTVVLPHRGTPDWLKLAVEFWMRQREEVFLLVVDTGSKDEITPRVLEVLEKRPRVEVARLGIGKTVHPVDGITAAMDYGFSRCPTDFLLATHTDLFPRHRDLVTHLLSKCGPTTPVVGWEMSPRGSGSQGLRTGTVAAGIPGHVCTMYHMETMDRIGAGWSLRRSHHLFGTGRTRDPEIAGWPDTETCLGKILEKAKVRPLFLGQETNHENQWTDHWVHARSRTAMGLRPRHHAVFKWAAETVKQWAEEERSETPAQTGSRSEPNLPMPSLSGSLAPRGPL